MNEGTKLYNEDNRLPEVFMAELDPIFQRLSKDDLLNRCLKGITQNQNEAANGILWSKCPKTKFCGARREFGLLLVQPLLHSTLVLLAKQ